MWYWNVILKSRQHGFTTLIDLLALDLCLFNDNIEAGIIAHTLKDVQHIFANKIKYPYENLPESIKARITATKCDANELKLSNNSSLRVGTSMRSSTLRFLHISEHGKICAKYPQKAEEIKAGTIPTLHEGSYFFDESTAEGGAGDFYDACQQAQAETSTGKKLNKMQSRFHFFAWHMDPKNQLDPEGVVVSGELKRYFGDLQAKYGIELSERQKAWYAQKKDGTHGLGRLMKREHPSTATEAFEQSVEGAIFGEELERTRKEGRIRFLPYEEGYPVYTFWDLGVGHPTSVGFVQFVNDEIRIIDYHEEANRGIVYHCGVVKQKGYLFAEHFLPHDGTKRSRETGTPLIDTVKELLKNTVTLIPRTPSKADSIEAAKQMFRHCFFDAEKTPRLIKCLGFYRYEWDEDAAKYKDEPIDDWSADAADMFQQIALVWISRMKGERPLGKTKVIDERPVHNNDYQPLSLRSL